MPDNHLWIDFSLLLQYAATAISFLSLFVTLAMLIALSVKKKPK